MGPIFAALVPLLAFVPLSAADEGQAQPQTVTVRSAHADLQLFPLADGPDRTLVLRLTLRPDADVHIYAPAATGSVGPTLLFAPDSGLEPVKADLPPGEPYVSSATGESILAYREPFTLTQTVRVQTGNRSASPADRRSRVAAVLRYQACTDRVCFKPEKVRLEWRRGMPKPGAPATPATHEP